MECQRPWIAHPLAIYCVPWLLIAPLYMLEWSSVLIYKADLAAYIAVVWVITPLVLSWLYWELMASRAVGAAPAPPPDFDRLLLFARWLLLIWFLASCLEVLASHGVPLLWLIRHDQKVAQDFGIPSIHGLVNSLLLASTTIYVMAGVMLRKPAYYLVLLMTLVWAIIAVSRELLMVALVQTVMIFLQHRKLKIMRFVFWGAVLALAVLLLFGAVGDFRSPAFVKRTAGITKAYPDWLPTGVIWVYMYVTTPLNNLIHTVQNSVPIYDWSFPNTLQELFPTVIRFTIFPYLDKWTGSGGNLVTRAFNVSSAYVGPAQDFGLVGTYLFAWLTMGTLVYFWKRRDLLGSFGYTLFGQCAFFSIFFNHFFYLPVVFQLIWFLLAVEIATPKARETPPKESAMSPIVAASAGLYDSPGALP